MKKSYLLALLTTAVLISNHILAGVAAAHPLGNFTINHYAGLHLTGDRLTLNFILDMAEIPTFQEISTFDTNDNGQADAVEAAGYHAAKCAAIQTDLLLYLNGHPARLELTASTVTFPSGAGDLPTLRLTCDFQVPLADLGSNLQIDFENNFLAEHLGWREIVVSGEGVTLQGDLSGMTTSLSRQLTAYPSDLLNNPANQRRVSFKVSPAAGSSQQTQPVTALSPQPDPLRRDRNDEFTKLITLQQITLPSILAALAVAFVWGAAHALTPGHGKTIVAAYLVGSRGTIRHAIFLGLTTTVTHTAGVFVLGFLTLFAARFILPEQLYPWLGVLSGALVIWIGLALFRGRLVGLFGGHRHHTHDEHSHRDHVHSHSPHHHDDHSHHHHSHEHYHLHDHDHGSHGHSHLPPGTDGTPVTWRSLLALGISGGLLPCPSALVVMLSAIALQRVGFGLVLIIAFSLGLAGVLTGIGVVWVQARRLFEAGSGRTGWLRHLAGRARLLQAIPAASALFITVVGAGITWQALMQTGVLTAVN